MTRATRLRPGSPFAWLLAALLLLGSGVAAAARIAEQEFEDRIRMADADLVLNGVGVRAVAWLKGYAAGLYLAERARTPAQALAVKGPKRIQMKMLVDAEAKEFVKAFDKGMRRNHTPAEQQAMRDRMLQLHDLIAQMGPLKKGDVVNLDFVPGTGLLLTVNGASRGSPVPGDDLYAGVMKIFIGNDPVDKNLKAGLLGNPA